MNKKNLFLPWLLLSISSGAYAACTRVEGPSNVKFSAPNSIVIQRDTPVGTIIWESTLDGDTPHSAITNCANDRSERTYLIGSDTGQITGVSAIYATNIKGIGYALSYDAAQAAFTIGKYPNIGSPLTGDFTLTNTTTSMRLVVTGSGPSGTINSGQYGRWTTGTVNFQNLFLSNSPVITRLACSITTPVINVPLDDILGNELNAVGTTAKSKNFNLGLNCDAGARVNVQMTGEKNTDTSTAGVLQLTSAGSVRVATGVGIQILYNNAPLALNDNIVLKTSVGGQELFPFVARYYQTKNPVTAGSANATMTLNLTYQ